MSDDEKEFARIDGVEIDGIVVNRKADEERHDSDDEDEGENVTDLFDVVISNPSPSDKRAHHNALERKRRDHIKDSFQSLQVLVPNINSLKASRAQILKKATDHIVLMKNKNRKHQSDIDTMRFQNKTMEQQLVALEKIKATTAFATAATKTYPPAAAAEQTEEASEEAAPPQIEEDAPPEKKRLRSST